MELDVIEHIMIKLQRKESYEARPLTDKQAKSKRSFLQKKLEKAENFYYDDPTTINFIPVSVLKDKIIMTAGPADYNLILQDLEKFKKQYIDEVPEKYWNYANFSSIFCLIKFGGYNDMSSVLKYIDTY